MKTLEEKMQEAMSQQAAEPEKAPANQEQTQAEQVVAEAPSPSENSEQQAPEQEEVAANTPSAPTHPDMKWYIVHTYSGYEQKAKQGILENMKNKNKEELFGDILIPTENVVEVSGGKKKTREKKFFPGYVFVQMVLNPDTWHIVNDSPRVTGFVGKGMMPPAIPEKEVQRLTQNISDGSMATKLKVEFDKGESVRVVDGPFQNFNGVVDDVNPDKGKLRVLVSIFGRSTPVELDYAQVEKN
jgi:transcriptional antiterminator NusG